eukprot:TRINITY_DN537_c0_g1_i2.p1 TRINITY_DN537_c0_g1~~TRINITY_DN537_c0_g1_i2.p1  ORF type:complete len:552 (+),score=198.33 TRINITY_DN537_c0_g1_i2:76-1731(+)
MGTSSHAGIILTALLGVILALSAVGLSKQWDGNSKQSCPTYNNEAYLFLGKSASKGEACGYLDNGASPRCINTELGLALRDGDDRADNGDLVCFRNTCTELLSVGEDCSIPTSNGNSTGVHAVCSSGACVRSVDGQAWTCVEEHSLEQNRSCTANSDCEKASWCKAGRCAARTLAEHRCTHIDHLATTLPGEVASIECESGLFCSNVNGNLRCLKPDYGTAGTPCPWDSQLVTETRPQCKRGHASCSKQGICNDLVAIGESCQHRVGAGYLDNLSPCEYGSGCHPNVKPDSNSSAWVDGTCTRVRSIEAGSKAYLAEFCKFGLFIDPSTDMCIDASKVGQSCSASSECDSSALDAGRATCQCTKANTLGSPGKCKKTPLTHSLVEHLRYPEECRDDFERLTTYLEQFWKRTATDEAGRSEYDREVDSLQHKGYCCMRSKVHTTSHMYYLSGMFAVDVDKVELRCNTDLVWLWIIIAVLSVSICVGICVVAMDAVSGDEVTPSESNLPYGSDSEDVVKQLMSKTALEPSTARQQQGSNLEFPARRSVPPSGK